MTKSKSMDFNNNILNKRWSFVISTFLLATIFFMNYSCDSDDTQTVTTIDNLVMSDEFDVEGTPDATLWNTAIGRGPRADGWGNNELQYYTARPSNIRVDNGLLLITARQEEFNGAGYTSARINTEDKFEQRYGRYEARIRVPSGKGIWPAFWLLGNDCYENEWPACGEIDVMEYTGDAPSVIFGSVHGPGYSGGESESKVYKLEADRFDTDFHVFGIEWGPDYINYYVDDKLYNQITPDDVDGNWVFDGRPFYIILNVAVGGNLPGAPNSETIFPQTMAVDYVRVYSE